MRTKRKVDTNGKAMGTVQEEAESNVIAYKPNKKKDRTVSQQILT